MQRVARAFRAVLRKKGNKGSDDAEDLALDVADLPRGPSWPGGSTFGCDVCSLMITCDEGKAKAENEGEEMPRYTVGRFHCQECRDFDVCRQCFSVSVQDEHVATFHGEEPFTLTVPKEYLFVEEEVSNAEHVKRIVRNDSVVPSIARYQHATTLEYSGRAAVGFRPTEDSSTSRWITFGDIGTEAELASLALRHLLNLKVQLGDSVPVEPFNAANECYEAPVYGGMSARSLIADLALLLCGPALASAHIHPSADDATAKSLFDVMSARCLFVDGGGSVCPAGIVSSFLEASTAEEGGKPLVIWMGMEPMPSDVKAISDTERVVLLDWEGLLDTGTEVARREGFGTRESFEVPLYHRMDVITIVFSSGTTGTPKGIPIADHCWRGYLESAPAASHTSAAIAYQPFSLSGPRQNYYHRNIVGARTFLCPNPARLYEDLLLCRPTIFSGPPRVFQELYQTYLHFKAKLIADAGEEEPLSEFSAATVANAQIRELLGGRVRGVSRGGAPTSSIVRDWLYVCFADYQVNESYGLTECSGITINGWITPEVRVKLTDWGEYKSTDKPYPRGLVWVKAAHQISGYYKKELTADTLSEDGYFCTGDIGEMVELGVQLRLLGRQKELVKLSHGEFVRPVHLENLFLDEITSRDSSLGLTQIFVHADSLYPLLVALCVCCDRGELPADQILPTGEKERALEVLMGTIGKERRLRRWETPVRVRVVPEAFSKANGLLTDSLKPSRRKIIAKYDQLLASMLDDASHSVTEDLLAALACYEEGRELSVAQLPSMLNVDSISAVQLANRIQANFGVQVPAAAVAICSSGAGLLELFGLIRAGELLPQDAVAWARSNEQSHTLAEDLLLPQQVKASLERSDAMATPELREEDALEVLLTGATGFVGGHLLVEILGRYPRARVHCIARRSATQSAEERLQSFLERRGCWKEAYSGRVLALEGDLCLPQLGLTEETWHALSASVRWVVHAGALVNATMPYTKHRPANVLSTRELLAFCVEGESKHLDFISSMSVYSSPADSSSEKTVISPEALPISGYGRSKAVGDILVKSAVDAGLSACIHRLGYIGPHSKTGACNEKDWLSVLLEGVRELAAMPPCSSAMQVLPVDALCKAFLVLSGKRAAEGIVAYHYTSEGTVPIADVLDCWKERILSAGGRDVDVVSLVAWRRLLAQSSLEQLKSLFSNGIPDRVGRPVALTSAALRHFGAGGDLFQTPAPLQCLIQL